MTAYEFEALYKTLEDAYPDVYGKKFRKDIIAGLVKDLTYKWFSALIKRIALNPHARIDIEEAARAERHAHQAILRSKETIQAMNNLGEQISDGGLDDVMKKLNANSLMDAIEKSKQGHK